MTALLKGIATPVCALVRNDSFFGGDYRTRVHYPLQ